LDEEFSTILSLLLKMMWENSPHARYAIVLQGGFDGGCSLLLPHAIVLTDSVASEV